MARLIDISPAVSAATAVFPGDVGYRRRVSLDLEQGDNLTLSSIETTVHIGAHADGPNHYTAGAPGIDARPLDRYYGRCQVVAVHLAPHARIEPKHLLPITAPRVLFRTDSYPDPTVFNPNFNSLSPAVVDFLHGQGVQLVGIDTPSVDPAEDPALLSHQTIARHDMAILEGLVLTNVAPGTYTLIALPLKLVGADAAPVRAALLDDSSRDDGT